MRMCVQAGCWHSCLQLFTSLPDFLRLTLSLIPKFIGLVKQGSQWAPGCPLVPYPPPSTVTRVTGARCCTWLSTWVLQIRVLKLAGETLCWLNHLLSPWTVTFLNPHSQLRTSEGTQASMSCWECPRKLNSLFLWLSRKILGQTFLETIFLKKKICVFITLRYTYPDVFFQLILLSVTKG